MKSFPNNRIGIMRHGEIEKRKSSDRYSLVPSSATICEQTAGRIARSLEVDFGCKKILILHSPIQTAKTTTEYMTESLRRLGIREVDVKESYHLMAEHGRITDELLSQLQPADKDIFLLLITHHEVIRNYLLLGEERWHTISHCKLITSAFR